MSNKAEIRSLNKLFAIIAIAAAVVAVFAAGILAVNYMKSITVEPEREDSIAALKSIVVEQPNNTRLIEHLRRKDLDYRQAYFTRQYMSKKAGYFLLIATIVMVSACNIGFPRKKLLPTEKPAGSAEQVRAASLARRTVTFIAIVLATAVLVSTLVPNREIDQTEPAEEHIAGIEDFYKNWPSFRGAAGDGVSPFTNIPKSFSVETSKNIKWKSPIPVFGNSSPVVWGDRIFLTGGDTSARVVMCYDAVSGGLLWERNVKVIGVPEEIEIMEDTGFAACTPATDGQRVYAIFATGEITAFDFDGNKVWSENLGLPESAYGYASSLAVYKDIVIVQYDQGYEGDNSKLIGIKGATGRFVWETKRDVPNSWTSPVVAKIGESYQVITVADPFVIAYDPKDGSEIWRVECVGGDVAPSPILCDGIVYAVEPDAALFAIKPLAKGAEGAAEVLWNVEEGAGDIVSPACDGQRIYLVSGGYLTCISVKTKEVLYEEDLGEMVMASPSIIGDMIFILTEEGRMLVLESADEFKKTESSELGENCYASPAFSDGRIYIRGKKNLYCIGATE